MAINISELYDAAEKQRLEALQTAQKENSRQLEETLSGIQRQYRSDVTDAQTSARISALGLEEKLAAQGLSGGSIYGRATSGYTESARIAQSNHLRGSLNRLMLSRIQSERTARSDAASRSASLTEQAQSDLSSLRTQRAQAEIDQYNADRTYAFNNRQANRTYTLNKTQADREYALANQKYQSEQKQIAYENALKRWETYGVVLPADAKILGVKAGTRTADSAYKQAKLAIDRIRAYK